MIDAGATFSLTQIDATIKKQRSKSSMKGSSQELKLPAIGSVTARKTSNDNPSNVHRSKSTLAFRNPTACSQSRGIHNSDLSMSLTRTSLAQARNTLTNLENQISDRLDNLFKKPRDLLSTIRRIEHSTTIKDNLDLLDNDLNSKKKEYNKLLYIRKAKESQLNMLETHAALIKPGLRDEPGWLERVKSLEYKILSVRKDLETEQNNASILQHMLITRQNNINLLSEPLSALKENLSKIASEKDEADNTLYRNLRMYKAVKNKIQSLRDNMKELRGDRELQKVENLTKFQDRAILIEFIKRQKRQEEIKKLVNKNEKELGNLEKVLRDTTESEEISKEIEACNAYITRQEQMFLKLKKMTNVTSIQEMPSHYGYLNETKRTLIANQAMLEQKIENAQNELNLRHNELNNAILENLAAAIDAESRLTLRKINIIEENILEKNRLLYDHKKQIDKKETLIAGICAILSRIKFQLQPDNPMKDITLSEVEKEMESITNKLSEMKERDE